MSKHTPGPWKVHEYPNGMLGIHTNEYVPSNRVDQLARINGDSQDEVYGPEVRADARLIAAAPELLAACEETAIAIHTYQERGSHKDREDLNRCWQTIRLAIAKATHHTGD